MTSIVTLLTLDPEELQVFHKWLLFLIPLEFGRVTTQTLLFRALSSSAPEPTIFILRYAGFLVDNVWLVWQIYGNVLYYMPEQITYDGMVCEILGNRAITQRKKLEFAFSELYVLVLMCGYAYFPKYIFEFILMGVIYPVWMCSRAGVENKETRERAELVKVKF